jgi:hypothetical protein
MKVPFSQIPVGRVFRCNGTLCYKRSTRTAMMVFSTDHQPFAGPSTGMWFYWRQTDICVT